MRESGSLKRIVARGGMGASACPCTEIIHLPRFRRLRVLLPILGGIARIWTSERGEKAALVFNSSSIDPPHKLIVFVHVQQRLI